jgi:hypothetical protein
VPPIKKSLHDDNSETETEWKKYTFSELTDLQSKLMLVAGKAVRGKDQVDRFMEV